MVERNELTKQNYDRIPQKRFCIDKRELLACIISIKLLISTVEVDDIDYSSVSLGTHQESYAVVSIRKSISP